jgi:hypothetical protein
LCRAVGTAYPGQHKGIGAISNARRLRFYSAEELFAGVVFDMERKGTALCQQPLTDRTAKGIRLKSKEKEAINTK